MQMRDTSKAPSGGLGQSSVKSKGLAEQTLGPDLLYSVPGNLIKVLHPKASSILNSHCPAGSSSVHWPEIPFQVWVCIVSCPRLWDWNECFRMARNMLRKRLQNWKRRCCLLLGNGWELAMWCEKRRPEGVSETYNWKAKKQIKM